MIAARIRVGQNPQTGFTLGLLPKWRRAGYERAGWVEFVGLLAGSRAGSLAERSSIERWTLVTISQPQNLAAKS